MGNSLEYELKRKLQNKILSLARYLFHHWNDFARGWMSIALIATDIIAILLAIGLTTALISLFGLRLHQNYISRNLLFVVFFLLVSSLRGLYPGVGLGLLQELKSLSASSTFAALAAVAYSYWLNDLEHFTILTMVTTWLLSLAIMPLGRSTLRRIGARLRIWGLPVAVIGDEDQTKILIEKLLRYPECGFQPVVTIKPSHNAKHNPKDIHTVWLNGHPWGHSEAPYSGIHTALIISNGSSQTGKNLLELDWFRNVKQWISVPDLNDINDLSLRVFPFKNVIGSRDPRNLLSVRSKLQKRIIDICIAAGSIVILSPIFLLVSALIRLTSPGPALYHQTRIGKKRKPFGMLKFRSMYQNAESELGEFFERDPELRSEWERYQKLKDDPRITPVGRILRKYSFDELPQFVNVLKGEMSVVGPRPFLPEQLELYGSKFKQYERVLPGITGLWQISGRSETEFIKRPYWDDIYVRNWSLWLDLYIIALTFRVVLWRDGAY